MLEISFLGRPEVRHSEVGVIELDPTELHLLAYLWLKQDAQLPRTDIADALWPNAENLKKRAQSLRTSLSKLKRLNELDEHEYVHITRTYLQFNSDAPFDVDAATFEAQVRRLDDTSDDYKVQLKALKEHYKGHFLVDQELCWDLDEKQRELFDLLDDDILQPLVFEHRQDREYEAAIEVSIERLKRRFYNEDIYQDLIYFHYLTGDRDNAIYYYELCKSKLAELELTPSADTEKLYQLVLERASAQEISNLADNLRVYASYPELTEQFIGREAECTRVLSHWERVTRGKGSTLFVAGVSGVGKTVLIRNFIDYFKNQNAIVLNADCRNSSATDPYRPWVEILRGTDEHITSSLIDRLGAARLAEVAELYPELFERFQGLEAPPELSEYMQVVNRRAEAITQYLNALAEDRPVVLMLDNLQWIEDAAFRLLAHLRQRSEDAPILILGAYREENVDPEHLIYDPMQEWSEGAHFERIDLKPFSRAEIAEYIQNAFDLDQEPESLTTWLLDGAKGKPIRPLYLAGILTWLMQNGAIAQNDSGDWQIDEKSLQLIEPPSQIRGLVLGNLERLDNRSQDLARLISTRASYFDIAFLEEALAKSPEEIESELEALQKCHFVLGSRHGYEFDHDMTREVIYESLSDGQLKRFHLQTAMALESMHERGQPNYGKEVLGEIADHFTAAQDSPNALHYSLAAGEYVWTKNYAKEEALRYFNASLELSLELEEPDLEHQSYFWLGKIQCSTDAHELGIENCQKALAHSEDVSERVEIYTMMINACRALHKYDEALELADQGLAELDEKEHPVEVAKLLDRAGLVHVESRTIDKAIAAFEKSIALLRSKKSKLLLASCLVNISLAYRHSGQIDASLGCAKESLEIAEENHSLSAQVNAYFAMGLAYSASGEPERAISWWERCASIYEQMGNISNAGWTYGQLSRICMKLNEIDSSLEYAIKRLEAWISVANRIEISLSYGVIGSLLLSMGQLSRSKECFDAAEENSPQLGFTYYGIILTLTLLSETDYAIQWLAKANQHLGAELREKIFSDQNFSLLREHLSFKSAISLD